MPRRRMQQGICHVCGTDGELSFEHVPPQAAFNNKRVIRLQFEAALVLGPDEPVNGPIAQGGVGGHTLCPRCNSLTGHWYGRHFIDWCYQGMDILMLTGGKPTLIYMHYLFPLAILKQIVTMFFSVNPPGFSVAHPELVRFVLNKDAKYLSQRYRFFTYYNTTGRFRFAGVTGSVSVSPDLQSFGNPQLMSEIGFTPFGYLMTIDSEPPDKRLFEITHFSRYSYGEFKVMELRLPVLPTHLFYPGDYRTKEEIVGQADRQRSLNQRDNKGD